MLNTKYINCVPHGFREEDILKDFPIISQFGIQRHGWQDFCKTQLNIATYLIC